jgi:hypothetical protein
MLSAIAFEQQQKLKLQGVWPTGGYLTILRRIHMMITCKTYSSIQA